MLLTYSLLIGYLLGCLQTPYLIVKFVKKVDIREYGSGNAGASNASRILGFKYGILIGVIDVLKAVLSVSIVKLIFHGSSTLMVAAGASCIVGHIYPIFLKFKGGKGVATTIGMLLAFNYILGILAILIIVLITIITNYVAIGSILIYVLLPVSFYYLGFPNEAVGISLFICMLGIFKHRGNIVRILSGNENVIFKNRK